MRRAVFIPLLFSLIATVVWGAEPAADVQLARDVLPLLKLHCVKCHGPAKAEAGLNLSTPAGLARGGESGAAIAASQPNESLLWQRIAADEMPPEEPLAAADKQLLKRWIDAGAPGLPTQPESVAGDHWAFAPLKHSALPEPRDAAGIRNEVDRFLLAQLEARQLTFNREADRPTLIRRVAMHLTGLPPTPEEIAGYLADASGDAYEQMVERYLASPHYGERWGKIWLDAAGYADSNGYFNADSDRPLAYRYRDYVVRAINQDKPFDRFVLEQIAGDELAGRVSEGDADQETISLLEATHFLRNAQDGTGESDGNPDEVRTDRYSVLEAISQIIGSSLLGLTVQCAKCHDHKFEPFTQREYYQLQSVFYPAFNPNDWLKPNQRVVHASLPGELDRWRVDEARLTAEIATFKDEFVRWAKANRPPSRVLFADSFDDTGPPLTDNWSNTAPGDDRPGGSPPVALEQESSPAALHRGGALQIVENGAAGDRWLSTRQAFDWTPDAEGDWIQVTFDLVDDKLGSGVPSARIGYFIALHDFDGNSDTAGGNLLIDGNPAGGASIHLGYPAKSQSLGQLGGGPYRPGGNFGVRITNIGRMRFRLEHLVDGLPEDKTIELAAVDLPDGGFGFEYCCGRSFVVDNVLIERSPENPSEADLAAAKQLQAKRKELSEAIKAKEKQRREQPGKIASVFERSPNAPEVFLLVRGNHSAPGEPVAPGPLAALDPDGTLSIQPPSEGAPSSGRRLAWARWLLQPGSRQAALVARVQVNRLWQRHFGTGIVLSIENLGLSGAPPSHPELLDYLALRLIESGWSQKAMHRLLLNSAAFRQSSAPNARALEVDPENHLLWRKSLARLDAETLRDAVLAASGTLDPRFGGPYVPTTRDGQGEVLVPADAPGATRRSLYLQQRRTQMLSMLNVFDSPTIVFNCVARPTSTMPLQSLSLLNSPFMVAQAEHFAGRLAREAGENTQGRIERAWLLALARSPSEAEIQAATEFITSQQAHYTEHAQQQAWRDFCQMLLASNEFLYLE